MAILRVVLIVAAAVAAMAAVIQPVLRPLPYGSSHRADAAALRRHVVTLTARPHSADDAEGLSAAATYIERQFRTATERVVRQEFYARGHDYRNIIARFGPESGPSMIVGAHYDAFGRLPGADDNASGAAGLLELARLLALHPPRTPVVLVAYANEEPPFFGSEQMGSAVHANSISKANVAGMICLEMIGYYTAHQAWPNATFEFLYPSEGDFIAVSGRWDDRVLTRHVKSAIRGAGMKACSFTGPAQTLDASDHRNYWSAGIRAVMITDTAYLRNPNYHTSRDTADTLDYDKMALVVDGVWSAVTR
ncbi:MAG TPA: M28 family peptidase [Thermoanaerobaculia bacterium]